MNNCLNTCGRLFHIFNRAAHDGTKRLAVAPPLLQQVHAQLIANLWEARYRNFLEATAAQQQIESARR
ncbi:MAG: hypothetical protein ABJD53_14495 [Gammaproteobacteria bacterium]